MPIPPLTGLPPKAEFSDVVRKINQLVQELVNALLNLDSLNVVSLTADHIDAGTINGNVVTIKSTLSSGYIQIDGNGMVVNDGTKDTFKVDLNGNVTITGRIEALSGHIGGFTIESDKLSSDSAAGIIQGGTIRTAPPNKQRIELSNGSFKGYTDDNLLSGLVFDPKKTNDLVDVSLYHRGAQLVQFFDDITQYYIRGGSAATALRIGGNSVTVRPEGTWNFSNATVSGFPISAVTNLQSQLDSLSSRITYLENAAFVNVYRVTPTIISFDSKNIVGVDSVDA